MKKVLATIALVLISFSFAPAQLVKLYSVSKEQGCSVSAVLAYDVEDPFTTTSSMYIAYMDGCVAKVVNMADGQLLHSFDVHKAGVDSAYAVIFYRNMFASDGNWTTFYATYKANGFSIYLFAGEKGQLLQDNATTYVLSWRIVDSNLYVVVNGKQEITVYLARNNVTAISALLPKSRYVTELGKIGLGKHLKARYDVLGSSVSEQDYHSLPDYGKRNIFGRP